MARRPCMSVFYVRKVGERKWYKSISTSLRDWEKLRLQPVQVQERWIEKRLFNGAWKGTTRKKVGELKEEFTDVWIAAESHTLGCDTSMAFARAEKLVYKYCIVLSMMGYDAEKIDDDSTYVCHLGSKEGKTHGVTRLGVRISNLLSGDARKAFAIYHGRENAVPKFDHSPRLVKMKKD